MSDFVKFFRDSSPYINAHRNKVFVLALSGETIAHENFTHIVHDIALLHNLGIKLVLVHGARPQIDQQLLTNNLDSVFADNKRITDSRALACVKDAVGSTRISIEALLSTGLANSPMAGARIGVCGGNVITAKPVGVRNGTDFHHTGEVRRVDKEAISQWLNNDDIVLISPLGYSPTGETFNLSYSDVATQVAISLQAEKLLVFSAHQGIVSQQGELQRVLALNEVSDLLASGSVAEEDVAAIQACYQACSKGIKRGHIISYLEDGALLNELFTRDGSGTLICHDPGHTLRPATIEDIGGLIELIAPLEESGALVRRSREILETEINRFTVVQHVESTLVACAALYPFNGGDSAELACVATHPDFRNQGLASLLLNTLEQQAKKQHIREMFVLTTHAANWFQEMGFVEATVAELPVEKQQCYNYQRNSKVLRKQLA